MINIKDIRKLIIVTLLFFLSIGFVNAVPDVIDVQIDENVYEQVLYNPRTTTSGTYADANEVYSLYSLNGTVTISNNHPTEAVQRVIVNLTTVSDVYNVSFVSGSQGYILATSPDLIISIPDLGAGQTTVFSYDINTTNVAPPLNFLSSYSDDKVLAGFQVSVLDTVTNDLNSTNYLYNCIENIVITQNTLTADVTGSLYNFTFDNTSMAGLDAGNASFTADNRTINWNLWGGSCFNSGNSTNLSYLINTDPGINLAQNYEFVNTTISYQFNDSVSRMNVAKIEAILDVDIKFEKTIDQLLTGDNASWQIYSEVSNPTNITVNLTSVTLWVSTRNGTGTGFTNPSIIDNDTVSGSSLTTTYNPNQLLNGSLADYNNTGSEWFFNYTFTSSPIVWMDLENSIVDDGLQLTDRSVSYGQNTIYVKEIYIATGYYLQITKNITRLAENNFTIDIKVINLGNSPTPSGQIVQVYNFIPNSFNLTSAFVYSTSPWYNTTNASAALNDPTYNGTMHQFALSPDGNPSNSSLNLYGGSENENNTWTVTYNLTGSGDFNFDDLFLTGVDPLKVDEFGATQALTIQGTYEAARDNAVYILAGIAGIVGLLVLFL